MTAEEKSAVEVEAELERARINSETAQIAWSELQRFFAQGMAIAVAPELDLVEVACQAAQDNAGQVGEWLQAGQVGPVADAQAAEWVNYLHGTSLWASDFYDILLPIAIMSMRKITRVEGAVLLSCYCAYMVFRALYIG